MLVHEYCGLGKKDYLNSSRELLYGIEYEIESISYISDVLTQTMKTIALDNSLRNNGKEFITNPNNFQIHLKIFDLLHNGKDLKFSDKHDPFSHRTSIHIHVNTRNLQVKTVKNIIHAYILTEKLFMNFVGPERENNIFCVPLYTTNLCKVYNNSLADMMHNWHKYTAFNLCRLGDLGTIEFRHLYGTSDRTVFINWFSAIHDLFEYFINHQQVNFLEECIKDRVGFVKQFCPFLSSSYSDIMLEDLTEDTYLDLLQGYL